MSPRGKSHYSKLFFMRKVSVFVNPSVYGIRQGKLSFPDPFPFDSTWRLNFVCPHVESNHDLRLRRPTLDPLSYEDYLILGALERN